MDADKTAYWMAIAIPASLLILGSITQKLVDNQPFHRSHFYVGLDLTIYYLAICFGNIVDLVREHARHANDSAYLYTAAMMMVGVLVLFVQTSIHQEWEKAERSGRRQFVWLCIVSNGIGLALLAGFVLAKWRGLI